MAKQNPVADLTWLRNAIDTLVANIRFAGADEPVDTIAITSSVPNEGKTTIATNLARALAENGNSVLLVECDVHRRSLAAMLGVHARTGLYSLLLGRVSLSDAVVPTQTAGMQFLDCEPGVPNPSNVFASAQFRGLVKRLRNAYDYVVFDTPPLSAYVDGAVVGAAADATLLVARWDYVKRDDVRASMEQLEKADVNVIGTVINCCETERDSYYYGDYKKGRRSSIDAPQIVKAPARTKARQHTAGPSFRVEQGGGQEHVAAPAPDSTAQFILNAGRSATTAEAASTMRRNHSAHPYS